MSDSRRIYEGAIEHMTIREILDLHITLATLGMFRLTQIESDPALEEMFVDGMCELAVGRPGFPIARENRYVESD
jgi:hypothetical protein